MPKYRFSPPTPLSIKESQQFSCCCSFVSQGAPCWAHTRQKGCIYPAGEPEGLSISPQHEHRENTKKKASGVWYCSYTMCIGRTNHKRSYSFTKWRVWCFAKELELFWNKSVMKVTYRIFLSSNLPTCWQSKHCHAIKPSRQGIFLRVSLNATRNNSFKIQCTQWHYKRFNSCNFTLEFPLPGIKVSGIINSEFLGMMMPMGLQQWMVWIQRLLNWSHATVWK